MANEKELKHLVTNDSWKSQVSGTERMEQGFLTPAGKGGNVVRIRIIDNKKAILTVKGPAKIDTDGVPIKKEFEKEFPLDEGRQMLELCASKLIKNRHFVKHGPYLWEIDVFEDNLAGLVVAELEDREGVTPFPPTDYPSFIGKDVSADMRYTNVSLAYNGLPAD